MDLLPVDDPRFGGDEGPQQGLNAALPAPEGGVIGLRHHRTLLPQKLVELLTPRDELWLLQNTGEQSVAQDQAKEKKGSSLFPQELYNTTLFKMITDPSLE